MEEDRIGSCRHFCCRHKTNQQWSIANTDHDDPPINFQCFTSEYHQEKHSRKKASIKQNGEGVERDKFHQEATRAPDDGSEDGDCYTIAALQ